MDHSFENEPKCYKSTIIFPVFWDRALWIPRTVMHDAGDGSGAGDERIMSLMEFVVHYPKVYTSYKPNCSSGWWIRQVGF